MNRKTILKRDDLLLILIIVSILVIVVFSLPAMALERDVLNISNTGEKWTDEWHVINTAIELPGGGRAGFYRRVGRTGDPSPPTGRNGILYLYPESSYKPARIIRKNIEVSGENPCLSLGVSASSIPRGDWGLMVKVNGRQLFEEITISGAQGWQDLSFDLSIHVNQRVDIVIEASATNHRNAYVFIDYIGIDEGKKPIIPALDDAAVKSLDHSSPVDNKNDSFDSEYKSFIELLNRRDEKSSQRNQRQTHQRQPLD